MPDMYPQLLLKHLSNYRISCSSQNLTLRGRWLACVETFCSINALFTEKPISNSCRMISAVSSRVAHSFSETLRQTDFEHYLTHTTEPTASSKWLGSMLGGAGGEGCKGGPKALYCNKSLFLVSSKTPTCGWWDSAHILAAVNPSNRHGNTELTQTMT